MLFAILGSLCVILQGMQENSTSDSDDVKRGHYYWTALGRNKAS